MTPRALLTTCLLLVIGNGCGSPPIAKDDYQAAYERAWCERAARCGIVADVASCRGGSILEVGQQVASVAAGRAGYDGDAARTCVDQLAAGDCGFVEPAACQQVFSGLRADAESCIVNADCRSGICAQVSCDTRCCAGVCTAPSGIGATCRSDYQCAEGLLCRHGGVTSTCQTRPGPDDPCDTPGQCPAGYFCGFDLSPSDAPVNGHCERKVSRGERCNATFGKDACLERDDYCDPATRTCSARVDVGGACKLIFIGLSPDGSTCRDESACRNGFCTLWPVGAGTPCEDACGVGYECSPAGLCEPWPVDPVCP